MGTGRFTQRDTLEAPLVPANANRYAFAANDPVNNSDPLGMVSLGDGVGDAAGVVVTAGLGIAGAAVKSTPVGLGVAVGGGCLAGMVTEAVSNKIDNEDTSAGDLGGSCISGAVT